MYDEGIISIDTYSAGQDTDVASMVDNDHLKYTKCHEFFRSFATLIF